MTKKGSLNWTSAQTGTDVAPHSWINRRWGYFPCQLALAPAAPAPGTRSAPPVSTCCLIAALRKATSPAIVMGLSLSHSCACATVHAFGRGGIPNTFSEAEWRRVTSSLNSFAVSFSLFGFTWFQGWTEVLTNGPPASSSNPWHIIASDLSEHCWWV